MAFELFQEDGRGFEPKASIRKQGQIGLNQGSISRYKLKDGENVLLAFDRENEIVGIKKVAEEQKGSKRIITINSTGPQEAGIQGAIHK